MELWKHDFFEKIYPNLAYENLKPMLPDATMQFTK